MSSSNNERNVLSGRRRWKCTKISVISPEQRAQFLERRRPPPRPSRTPAVLPLVVPLRWERRISRHICHSSGVLHFPKHIGRKIPAWKSSIVLHLNGTMRDYQCSIRTTARGRDEKYLHGEGWLDFVKEQGLKIDDVLKFKMRGSPLTIYVDIVRV